MLPALRHQKHHTTESESAIRAHKAVAAYQRALPARWHERATAEVDDEATPMPPMMPEIMGTAIAAPAKLVVHNNGHVNDQTGIATVENHSFLHVWTTTQEAARPPQQGNLLVTRTICLCVMTGMTTTMMNCKCGISAVFCTAP